MLKLMLGILIKLNKDINVGPYKRMNSKPQNTAGRGDMYKLTVNHSLRRRTLKVSTPKTQPPNITQNYQQKQIVALRE